LEINSLEEICVGTIVISLFCKNELSIITFLYASLIEVGTIKHGLNLVSNCSKRTFLPLYLYSSTIIST
jgi:hypothetical protein